MSLKLALLEAEALDATEDSEVHEGDPMPDMHICLGVGCTAFIPENKQLCTSCF
jgi:hypothetical protein